MSDRLDRLDARVDQLEASLARALSRIEELEGRRRPRGLDPFLDAPAAGDSTASPVDHAGLVGSLGLTVFVLAGAYLLRALTEAGQLPSVVGVVLALAYAGLWLVLGDRSAADRPGRATALGAAAALIGLGVIYESTARFELFSAVGSALAMTLLLTLVTVVAVRRDLPVLTWVICLATPAAAFAAIAATHAMAPFLLPLLAAAIAADEARVRRKHTLLRWFVAFFADVAALLLAVLVAGGKSSHGEAAALLVLGALIVTSIGRFAWRACRGGSPIGWFESVQSAVVVIVAGLGLAQLQPTGLARTAAGLAATLLAAAGYAVVLRTVGQPTERERLWFLGPVSLVLALAGTWLLLPIAASAGVWAFAAVVLMLLAGRREEPTHALHAAAFFVAAWLGSGLAAGVAGALFLSGATPAAMPVVALLVTVVATVGAFLARSQRGLRAELGRGAALLVGTSGVCWSAVALGAALLASSEATATASTVIVLGSVSLALAAVLLARLGKAWSLADAMVLAYAVLAIGGVKLLIQDLPDGRAAGLVVSLAAYGAALLLVSTARPSRSGSG